MLELYLEALLAFLLLAAASYRLRRDAGIDDRAKQALRWAGVALLALAFWRAGTALDGERLVRALLACSLAAITLVLALSAAPALVLAPIRGLVGMVQRRRG